MKGWVKFNVLSLVMFGAFVVFLVLQSVFGWLSRNEELTHFGRAAESYWTYLGTGHFGEATFENWESEFLQMGAYVVLTAFLIQKGSPESREPGSPPPESAVTPESPWPVRRGGLIHAIYRNSLAIALLGLFLMSFVLHILNGTSQYNEEQALLGKEQLTVGQFAVTSRFWFESMQNWQSEFLAVGALIVLSIFLRQRGSSQSKPVEAPHARTGG
jgi:hypothetical protein